MPIAVLQMKIYFLQEIIVRVRKIIFVKMSKFVYVALTPNQRSLTLPSGQHPYAGHHQRSLSESKTFDIVRHYEQKQRLSAEMSLRYRDNSITESTTSGVSSCDSMFGKNITLK